MDDELVTDSLVYRYDPAASPDGLRGSEGTFSLCTFAYVDALARAGRLDDARLAFEKMLTYANHVGLYSEEIAADRRADRQLPAGLHPPVADRRGHHPGRGAEHRSPAMTQVDRPRQGPYAELIHPCLGDDHGPSDVGRWCAAFDVLQQLGGSDGHRGVTAGPAGGAAALGGSARRGRRGAARGDSSARPGRRGTLQPPLRLGLALIALCVALMAAWTALVTMARAASWPRSLPSWRWSGWSPCSTSARSYGSAWWSGSC